MVFLIDFDGVVNKSDYFSVQYEKDFGVSQEEISKFFISDFESCAIGNSSIEEKLTDYLKKWKWKKGVSKFLEYWFKNDIKLDFELINFISENKNPKIKWILVSQQEINSRNYIWESKQLNKIFDRFYCTCEIGKLKSDKKFYEFIIKDLIQRKEIETIKNLRFIDDSPEFIEAAKECKIECELFTSNSRFYNLVEKVLVTFN